MTIRELGLAQKTVSLFSCLVVCYNDFDAILFPKARDNCDRRSDSHCHGIALQPPVGTCSRSAVVITHRAGRRSRQLLCRIPASRFHFQHSHPRRGLVSLHSRLHRTLAQAQRRGKGPACRVESRQQPSDDFCHEFKRSRSARYYLCATACPRLCARIPW